MNKSDDSYAEPDYYPSDFGKGIKSDIYFFRDALERLFIETVCGDIEIPIEERIRATLRHEYSHVKEIFKGIDLGEGLVINSTNYFDINPSVKTFVGEVNSYLGELELAQQFGKEHPVYWFTLSQLMSNVTDYYNKHIKSRKFTPYETRLIEVQKNKVDAIQPEAKQFFEELLKTLKNKKCSTNQFKYLTPT